jgi:hypothetical protein
MFILISPSPYRSKRSSVFQSALRLLGFTFPNQTSAPCSVPFPRSTRRFTSPTPTSVHPNTRALTLIHFQAVFEVLHSAEWIPYMLAHLYMDQRLALTSKRPQVRNKHTINAKPPGLPRVNLQVYQERMTLRIPMIIVKTPMIMFILLSSERPRMRRLDGVEHIGTKRG